MAAKIVVRREETSSKVGGTVGEVEDLVIMVGSMGGETGCGILYRRQMVDWWYIICAQIGMRRWNKARRAEGLQYGQSPAWFIRTRRVESGEWRVISVPERE